MNVKYVYQCVGDTQLIVEYHQSKIHNWSCWSSKMHLIDKLFNCLTLLFCFCRSVIVVLEYVRKISKTSKLLRFPCVSLHFAYVLALISSTTIISTFIYNLNQSQASFRISYRDKCYPQDYLEWGVTPIVKTKNKRKSGFPVSCELPNILQTNLVFWCMLKCEGFNLLSTRSRPICVRVLMECSMDYWILPSDRS